MREFENCPYEVSDRGNIRTWTFRGRRLNHPRPITPYEHNKRYFVRLYTETGQCICRGVANLVLSEFKDIPARGETHVVDYKDGDAFNVNLDNLSWRSVFKVNAKTPGIWNDDVTGDEAEVD